MMTDSGPGHNDRTESRRPVGKVAAGSTCGCAARVRPSIPESKANPGLGFPALHH
jgi:hypothetical protein